MGPSPPLSRVLWYGTWTGGVLESICVQYDVPVSTICARRSDSDVSMRSIIYVTYLYLRDRSSNSAE